MVCWLTESLHDSSFDWNSSCCYIVSNLRLDTIMTDFVHSTRWFLIGDTNNSTAKDSNDSQHTWKCDCVEFIFMSTPYYTQYLACSVDHTWQQESSEPALRTRPCRPSSFWRDADSLESIYSNKYHNSSVMGDFVAIDFRLPTST